MRNLLPVIILTLHVLAACGTDAQPIDSTASADTKNTEKTASNAAFSSLPCAVEQVLATKCQKCHGHPTTNTAPMSLTTLSELHAAAVEHPDKPARVYERVAERIHDAARPMPPRNEPGLTEQELSVLDLWTSGGAAGGKACSGSGAAGSNAPAMPAAGAAAATKPTAASSKATSGSTQSPKQDGADAGTAETPTASGPATQPDTTQAMGTRPDPEECEYVELRARQDTSGTPYQVAADATDLYACFLFSLGFDAPTQGLSFENITDNSNVVHHWVLRSIEPSDVPTRGPFINCDNYYGTSKTIASWAPGTSDFHMPKDVGMEIGSGLFYLEMHYNNIGRPATTDASGVRICTTKKLREQTASVSWLGNQLFSVPPKASNHEVSGRCVPARHTQPIHVIRTWPHMHKLGVRSKMEVQRSAGTRETIFDAPFAFDSQDAFEIPFTLMPGDSIMTSCYFTNPGNTAVTVGTKTTDEMCHFFVVAYPTRALTNDTLSTETQVCL